ncbi:hypothetical protein [Apibacter adventoris]|uniref:Uncharacterized protein n=1 Tax=Apibacter adventoris TaxID=1679466 RepID=A0A2S8AGS1_9FLAO|nr:hypothetical protein [Apibacter adventoris]PQL95581.1 hypothetical protein C4S77_01955 [Apibacter adventoris]
MKKLIVVIIFLLCSCNSETKKNKISNEKMSNISVIDKNSFNKEYIKQNFWKCHYDSAGEDLKYYIFLPKDVKPISIEVREIKGSGLFNIGTYARVDSTFPYLEVWVYSEKNKSNKSLINWVREKLKIVGQEIIYEKKKYLDNGKEYLDVVSKKSSVITRTTELINEKGFYIMVSVSCDVNEYEKLSETIQFISSNWGCE